jgi:hypothetical protein
VQKQLGIVETVEGETIAPASNGAEPVSTENGTPLLDEGGEVVKIYKRSTPWFESLKRLIEASEEPNIVMGRNREAAAAWVKSGSETAADWLKECDAAANQRDEALADAAPDLAAAG